MSFLRKKILILIAAILLILIPVLILLITSPGSKNVVPKNNTFGAEILKYREFIPAEALEKNIPIINNSKLSENQRYDAFLDIFFYIDNQYFNTSDPRIRKLASEFDKLAKENFKDSYEERDFFIACADEECGEKTPPEIESLLTEIKTLPIDEVWINSITLNIKTASHIPYDTEFNRLDKLHSYTLAIGMLTDVGDPASSRSAEKLRKFIKEKYDKEI